MTLNTERIDWSATGAMAAAIIALAAFALSIWSLKAAHRSANAAIDAAREARRVADTEVGRRHDELDPHPKATFSMESSRNHGGQNLFASLTVGRPCRIVGFAVVADGSRRPLSLPLPVRANVPVRVHVEDISEDRAQPVTEHLMLRIWPPSGIDDMTAWTCPCSQPQQRIDDQAAGHWEHTIRVGDIERDSEPQGMWM